MRDGTVEHFPGGGAVGGGGAAGGRGRRLRSPGALLGSVVFQGGLVDEAECASSCEQRE